MRRESLFHQRIATGVDTRPQRGGPRTSEDGEPAPLIAAACVTFPENLMPARHKTAAELIRQRAEEARRFLESPEAQAQEEAARLVAAYRAALDALTEAEGVEKVQTEVGRWWSVRSGGGLVKFLPKGRR